MPGHCEQSVCVFFLLFIDSSFILHNNSGHFDRSFAMAAVIELNETQWNRTEIMMEIMNGI